MDELWQWDAAALADGVRASALDPVEIVAATYARIDEVDSDIHAYCAQDRDRAVATASEVARRVAAGEPVGPLAGVTVGVKDLIATAGLRTAFGSWHYRDFVPAEDDVAVARLRAADAVVLGKTTASEFGYAAVGENAVGPGTRNPWDPRLTSGGSSAGSAAAVAYGGAALALGSDGGGSIRIPASLCGVVGFKPSMGRVPAWPGCKDERLPGVSSWDALEHIGPITRTVRDAALAFRVLAGPHHRDRFSHPLGGPAAELGRPVRVAVSYDYGYVPVEPAARAATRAVAGLLEELGCEVVERDPGWDDPFSGFAALIASETDLSAMRALAEEHPFEPYVMDVLTRDWTAADLTDGRRVRQQVCRVMADLYDDVDLMLTPTSPVAAFEPGGIGPDSIDGTQVHPAYWLSLAFPVNLTGQPAISLPAGRTPEGLPLGVQLVGPHLGDELVLEWASRLESALNHPRAWPLTATTAHAGGD